MVPTTSTLPRESTATPLPASAWLVPKRSSHRSVPAGLYFLMKTSFMGPPGRPWPSFSQPVTRTFPSASTATPVAPLCPAAPNWCDQMTSKYPSSFLTNASVSPNRSGWRSHCVKPTTSTLPSASTATPVAPSALVEPNPASHSTCKWLVMEAT